jgi:hypothetical protein
MPLKRVKVQHNFGRIFFIGISIFIAIVIISLYFFRPPQIPWPTTTSTTTQTTPAIQPPELGTIIIALKDKSQRVGGIGTLNELFVNITKVEVHFVDQENDVNASGEWKTVFSGSKIVDLLTLTDLIGIIDQKELPAGKYTQIRLDVENVIFNVTNTYNNVKNKRYGATVSNSSGVPSGELRFVHPFNITANKTTLLTIDFDIQQSVKRTADGYTLAPVVKVTDEKLEMGLVPTNSVNI